MRPSPIRILALKILEESAGPLSAQDIESGLDTVDRSSITRTLGIFQSHHLIHAISDGSGAVKYEPCHESHQHGHSDEHVHFHCLNCGETICLSDIPLPEINLPEGFEAQASTFVISGLCPKCNKH